MTRLLVALLVWPCLALAQSYPAKPIRDNGIKVE